MKVKMIQQMSGPRHDGSDWPNFGEILDAPDWEGPELIAGGLAVPVAEERKVESAAMVADPKVELRGEDSAVDDDESSLPVEMRRRGPGRPPGSLNKPKP